MVIQQGDIFWTDLDEPRGSEPGYVRPCVVVQNNMFNSSGIQTTVICVLTSQLKRGTSPGNVTLRKGEANLPRASVANISQMYSVDNGAFIEKIGTLSKKRLNEILVGIQFMLTPSE